MSRATETVTTLMGVTATLSLNVSTVSPKFENVRKGWFGMLPRKSAIHQILRFACMCQFVKETVNFFLIRIIAPRIISVPTESSILWRVRPG